jgi:hypothetical protein
MTPNALSMSATVRLRGCAASARPRSPQRVRHRPTGRVEWSGRRGSNPRPTAWKAVTLPLSYSRPLVRLRGRAAPLRRDSLAARSHLFTSPALVGRLRATRSGLPGRSPRPATGTRANRACPAEARAHVHTARAKAGGEGRIRTSEATWATDLQSVAFDRSATSPKLLPVSPGRALPTERLAPRERHRHRRQVDGAGEGI